MGICEFRSQVTKELDRIIMDLSYQTLEAINSVIADKVLPSIQKTLGEQEKGFKAIVDLRCSGLHKNSKAEQSRKTWDYCP